MSQAPTSSSPGGSPRRPDVLDGPFWMLISAALFGYFGFMNSLSIRNAEDVLVPSWLALVLTLQISAIGFGLFGLVTFVHRFAGNAGYSVIGILSTLGLIAAGVLDLLDDNHAMALSTPLLAIFIAFNGYMSIQGLRAVIFVARTSK